MILARGLPRIALLALTLHLSQPAAAQGIRSARIEGRVLDSARARPLVGARVVAVGPDARESVGGAALTDTSGQTATIDLGLPPSPTLRGALCPGVALPPQTGVMYGHVVDAETARSLPDVVLALSWGERDFDRATLRSVNHERTASATTDAGGWYRLCGVPTDTWLSFQLQHKGRTGPVLRVMVQDSLGLAVRHLSFAGSAAADAPDSLSSHAEGAIAPPPSGTARLSGIVRGAGDAPLALVDVGVRGTGAASRTDALGHYSLGGLPAGTQTLDIRRLGYDPAEFSVEAADRCDRDARCTPAPHCEPRLRTRCRTALPLPRVQRTRECQSIRRLPRPRGDAVADREPVASDVIGKIPGFRIRGKGFNARVGSGRAPYFCLGDPTIVIDGLERQYINDIPATTIGAIAAYRAGEIAPGNFDRGCGAILIWTKR